MTQTMWPAFTAEARSFFFFLDVVNIVIAGLQRIGRVERMCLLNRIWSGGGLFEARRDHSKGDNQSPWVFSL